MKTLITFIPSLVKAGFKLWEKSKEWSAKKRIAVLIVAPLALVATSLTVYFVGPEHAQFAVQLLTETLEAFAQHM